MNVFVLSKNDSYDRSEILGVFATIEVAKTIAETEEPGRRFDWDDDESGGSYAHAKVFGGPTYTYSIEKFEVREG